MLHASDAPRRYNSWVVTVPILVGCVGYFWFFYRPTQQAIRDMRAEIDANRAVLESAETLPVQFAATRQELGETKRFVTTWREGAKHRQLPSVYEQLSNIVAEAGGQGAVIVPEPALRQRCLTRVPVTLSCRGTYPQVFEIVRRIEQLPNSLWIDELRIARERKTAGDVTCQIKLAVFTDQSNVADNAD